MNKNFLKCLCKTAILIMKVKLMTNKRNFNKSVSIRTDKQMDKMLEELGEKLLLNTTSIMRLALSNLYEKQCGDNDVL